MQQDLPTKMQQNCLTNDLKDFLTYVDDKDATKFPDKMLQDF